MIDTVAFTVGASLRPEYESPCDLPASDWSTKACGRFDGQSAFQSVMVNCKRIDLTIFGKGRGFTSVRANLPKLLFGHNGRVITSEDEFQSALRWLDYLLHFILQPTFPNKAFVPGLQTTIECHFTRIDLVWQFPRELGVFFALCNAEHEKIRSSPSFIKGQTVHLRGSFLELLSYDKVAQMKLRKHLEFEVDRVEFRLKGKALSEIYRGPVGEGYGSLPFVWCKRVMHIIAAETNADPFPVAEGTMAQFLAEADAKAPLLRIIELYEHIRRLRPETRRKLRKEINACRRVSPDLRTFADFFSNGNLPPPRQIYLPDVELAHQEWLRRHVRDLHENLAAFK